jgi:hypothetical protein
MISNENGLLRGSVLMNVRGRYVGGFVDEAQRTVARTAKMPAGIMLYENRAEWYFRNLAGLGSRNTGEFFPDQICLPFQRANCTIIVRWVGLYMPFGAFLTF